MISPLGSRLRSERAGTSLIELLVALAIMGLIAGVVGLALQAAPMRESPGDPYARLTAVRRYVISTGNDTTIVVLSAGRSVLCTAYPDGSVVFSGSLLIDRLSGRLLSNRSSQLGYDSLWAASASAGADTQ